MLRACHSLAIGAASRGLLRSTAALIRRHTSTDAARHVVIVGGGISGLTAAHALRKSASRDRVRITVLESSNAVGGWLSTSSLNEFVFENGCRGIRCVSSGVSASARSAWHISCSPVGTGVAAMQLIEELGLAQEACVASDAARVRFLWHNKELQALPSSFVSLLKSDMLREMKPWQLLRDLSVRPGPGRVDVSVHEFVLRHAGSYPADVLIDAVMSGVYAGDVKRLSAAATLKSLWQVETCHGSFIRAALNDLQQQWRNPKSHAAKGALSPFVVNAARAASVSFKTGMQALPLALLQRLAANDVAVYTGTAVTGLGLSSDGRVRVSLQRGPEIIADNVICSSPAHAAAYIMRSAAPPVAEALRALRTTDVAIVCFGYRCDGLIKSPGFGYLVPSDDRTGVAAHMLGMIWDSAVFPQQRPAERDFTADTPQTRLTLMFGGDTAPGVVRAVSEQEWHDRARDILRVHMGINRAPDEIKLSRAMAAIPQYDVGHLARVSRIRELTHEAFQGKVTLLGNSYDGIGVADCISNALAAGEEASKRVLRQAPTTLSSS